MSDFICLLFSNGTQMKFSLLLEETEVLGTFLCFKARVIFGRGRWHSGTLLGVTRRAGGRQGQRLLSRHLVPAACAHCSLKRQFRWKRLLFDSTHEAWQGENLPVTTTAQTLNTFVYMSSDFSKSTSREPKCPEWLNLFCLKSAGEGRFLGRVRSWYSFKSLKFNNINYFFLTVIFCESEHGEREMLALTSGRIING